METVKVDIQKLQLLNDRIAQTIDALNQVRLSVHGIQHSPAYSPWAYAQPQYAAQPQFASPYSTFAPSYAPQFVSPFVPGIQHTSMLPYAQPFVPGLQQQAQSPFVSQAAQPVNVPTAWTMPYVQNGISHTSAFDPLWQTRLFGQSIIC
jgi:hypothetical protein